MLDTWQILGWQRFPIDSWAILLSSWLVGFRSFLYIEIPQEWKFGRNTLWNCGTETWAGQRVLLLFSAEKGFFSSIFSYILSPLLTDRAYVLPLNRHEDHSARLDLHITLHTGYTYGSRWHICMTLKSANQPFIWYACGTFSDTL